MGPHRRGHIIQTNDQCTKIETKAMQLDPKFSTDKYEALWYRSNDSDWNFKIAGEEIPWRASVKYLRVIIDKILNVWKQVHYIRQKNMMRHKLQMLPVEHRAELSRAKLYRKIRGNTKHQLHTTINRRQRNGWTTEIQKCRRLTSRQLEYPTQLQRDDTVPWEQLPYECRIDWTKERNTEAQLTRIHPF